MLNESYQQKGYFYKQVSISSNALPASDKVAHRIAKCKGPHTFGELILPAGVDMVKPTTGQSAGFSALALMKSKYSSKINVENDIFQFNSTI